jgi:small conductance mechanosensitive channel
MGYQAFFYRFFLGSRGPNLKLRRCILMALWLLAICCICAALKPAYAQGTSIHRDTVKQGSIINEPHAELRLKGGNITGSIQRFATNFTEHIGNVYGNAPQLALGNESQNIDDGPFQPSEYLANFQGDVKQFWAQTLAYLPALALGMLIFVTLFWLSSPLASLFIRPLSWLTQSELIRLVTQRIMSLLIILLGLYIFLRLAGLTQFAIAIISSTGVIGLILGFAFKDIAENFISSLLLSVQRPFKIGDVIAIEGYLGVVKKVTARATILVDYDGNHIQIPNATIYKNVIKNLTANPRMRGHFVLGIGYDASVRKAQSIAMQIMTEHPGVLDDPEPQILIDNLGSSTINLQVYFWVNIGTHSVPKVASNLMRLLVRAYEAQQISMPDDARERIFPQGLGSLPSGARESTQQAGAPIHEQTNKILEDSQNTDSDDISSDTDDIRQQAAQSRDPESGANII